MNRELRIWLYGIIAVVLCVVVPFRVSWKSKDAGGDSSIGYRLFFMQPSPADAMRSIRSELPEGITIDGFRSRRGYEKIRDSIWFSKHEYTTSSSTPHPPQEPYLPDEVSIGDKIINTIGLAGSDRHFVYWMMNKLTLDQQRSVLRDTSTWNSYFRLADDYWKAVSQIEKRIASDSIIFVRDSLKAEEESAFGNMAAHFHAVVHLDISLFIPQIVLIVGLGVILFRRKSSIP